MNAAFAACFMDLEVDLERLLIAHKAVRAELLADFSAGGYWVGEISSSPVATAAAISALVLAHRQDSDDVLRKIQAGESQTTEQLVQSDLSELLLESVHWLARRQNADGGWGDCEGARSNIAATMMVQAAFRLTGVPGKYADLTERADDFVESQGGVSGLRQNIGDDKTYLASILTTCAVADVLPWRQVPTLPFEWLNVPKRWRDDISLPVARWGAPIVMAVGLAKFEHDPPKNPITRIARRTLKKKTLEYLQQFQAADDSFQASPLATAMVVLSLASIGCQDHKIVQRGVEFLLSSVRADASWALATSLATNNSTLALEALLPNALRSFARDPISEMSGDDIGTRWPLTISNQDTVSEHLPIVATAEVGSLGSGAADATESREVRERCIDWLLGTQRVTIDEATGTSTGGWGASDAPGADSNSIATAGALLTLARAWDLGEVRQRGQTERAAELGIDWLLKMQNDDGGWPTYCRDDDSHPMDRSGVDPSAQALRALAAWQRIWYADRHEPMPSSPSSRLEWMSTAVEQGFQFLESQQREDGSFVPVWFGNEHHADAENLILGTAQVLVALADLHVLDSSVVQRAADYLVASQHAGGGWGPPRVRVDYSGGERDKNTRTWRENDTLAKYCSVEETAAAVSALVPLAAKSPALQKSVSRGLAWLATAVEQDRHRQPAIVGFYLGQIWYYERLYPLAFAAGALSRAVAAIAKERQEPAISSQEV